MTKVGFTGTRQGMTEEQIETLKQLLNQVQENLLESSLATQAAEY